MAILEYTVYSSTCGMWHATTRVAAVAILRAPGTLCTAVFGGINIEDGVLASQCLATRQAVFWAATAMCDRNQSPSVVKTSRMQASFRKNCRRQENLNVEEKKMKLPGWPLLTLGVTKSVADVHTMC